MSGSATPPPDAAGWQDLLAVEHLAVFGYGLVGGRLAGAAQLLAHECENAHRARRDGLVLRLADLGAEPVAAAPAYALAAEEAPLMLAVRLEEQVAAVAVGVIGAGPGSDVRRSALATVTDAALRAARWRTAAGVVPALVPFPGRG